MTAEINSVGGAVAEIGSRAFPPNDSAGSAVEEFVHGLCAQVCFDGTTGKDAASISVLAFSLFSRLGADSKDVRVRAYTTDSHLILEFTNGLGFREVLGDGSGRLEAVNLDMAALVAVVDEVRIGHADGGTSVVSLAIQLPAGER